MTASQGDKPSKNWAEIANADLDFETNNEDELSKEQAQDESNTEPKQAAPAAEAGILEHPSYKALEQQLTEAEQLAHKYKDDALRAMSEAANIQRRAEQKVEKAHKFALDNFAQDLLPVIDSMEQALAASDPANDATKSIYEGVALTEKMLLDVLAKFGITQIDPTGEAFDPNQHEAMSMQESAEHPANTVITVFQKGYMLHERVIRPARVIVSKASN